MAISQMSEVIQHLRRVVLLREGAGLTDGQLLKDYLGHRDEAALAALVQRHAPMVWGVCRRVLRNYHDAEDAFQATFLVFVRKAASIASPELLANWLYGVAHQTALNARAMTAKTGARERQVTEMPEPAAMERDLWADLQPLLDQELSCLPDKYRVAIVLCDLEGKTRKEAARQLAVPEGTLAARLARGRVMLAKRLGRHGLAVSGGALAAVLAQNAASASAPTSVVGSTIKAASLFAAGQAAATAVVSAKVAALTQGVMKSMLFSKLKTAIAIVLILGFVATGATILTCRTAAGQDDKKPAAEKSKEEKEVPPASGVNLIMNKSVQKELNLTADQMKDVQAGVKKVHEKYLEQLANIPVVRGDPTRAGSAVEMPDPKKVAELRNQTDAENKKLLAEVLKPKQISRLKQIDLQLEGIRALLQNKEVALALKLTDDQKGKVKKLFEDIHAHATSVAPLPNPDDDKTVKDAAIKAHHEAWNEAFKKASEKIPSLLAPEQRRRWEAMTGAPFQLEPEDEPVRPPGGAVPVADPGLDLVIVAGLVADKSLQEDLKLTADQVKDIAASVRKIREKYQPKLNTLDPKERSDLLAKFDDETRKAAAKVLKPEQAKRLKQIERQSVMAGLYVILDEKVAKELKLTDDQKAKIKGIIAEHQKEITKLGKENLGEKIQFGGLDNLRKMVAHMKAVDKLTKAAMADINEVLTANQRKAWKELIGEPFEPTSGRS